MGGQRRRRRKGREKAAMLTRKASGWQPHAGGMERENRKKLERERHTEKERHTKRKERRGALVPDSVTQSKAFRQASCHQEAQKGFHCCVVGR